MTSDARGTLYVDMPALPNVQTIDASVFPSMAWRMLNASSGPSTIMIDAPSCPAPMRMTLPAITPRLYLLMPLCSRFFPSGVSNTLWMPCTFPSSFSAGNMMAGPS